jgi:hypothetical protein
MFCQPDTPETAIKARRAATIRKRRLLPVFTAANPRRSVTPM